MHCRMDTTGKHMVSFFCNPSQVRCRSARTLKTCKDRKKHQLHMNRSISSTPIFPILPKDRRMADELHKYPNKTRKSFQKHPVRFSSAARFCHQPHDLSYLSHLNVASEPIVGISHRPVSSSLIGCTPSMSFVSCLFFPTNHLPLHR